MPKNIVICADGTGNTTIKGRGTNVFKLYEAVDENGHRFDTSGRVVEQVAIEVPPNEENRRYLTAKRDKLGHRLHHQDLKFEKTDD